MFAAQVSFPKGHRGANDTSEAALEMLSYWLKNGQILGDDWTLTDTGDTIAAYVTIPERASLRPARNNRYVSDGLAKLQADGYGPPTIAVLGRDPSASATCSCKHRAGLVLFTHFLTTAPPVRCLDCFRPVPLYHLPYLHDEEHLDLLQWAADYRACDTLQMHCTTGERFAEKQLSSYDSSLSRQGRALCAQLEALTRKPIYYWLMKVRSRNRTEELARRCPSCGGEWRLGRKLCDLFDFRCKSCRLLSAIAWDAQ